MKENRTKLITVRVTPTEHAGLARDAGKLRMSVSQLVAIRALAKAPLPGAGGVSEIAEATAPIQWRCAGCGAFTPDRWRSCRCATSVVHATGYASALKRGRAPHWAVTVYRDGEPVLTIGHNELSGRDISPADEDAIRTSAHHLLAFIGEDA
jgi:hypothetical protein